MAARLASSSSAVWSVLAAHASLSGASLLKSSVGSSQESIESTHRSPAAADALSTSSALLPWMDQLHDLIAVMYVRGDVRTRRLRDSGRVQMSDRASLENPLASYLGSAEIDGAFKARLSVYPRSSDVKTELECLHVRASDDSATGGSNGIFGLLNRRQEENPPLDEAPSSPPNVEVTYRLSQHYGSYFSTHSLLVVTVQVRRSSFERIRNLTPDSAAMPLATSSFTPRAVTKGASALVSTQAAAAISEVNNRLTGIRNRRVSGDGRVMGTSPFVAEVVRIEERWNGVQLLNLPPFQWSRRVNGFVAGCATYLFFN